MRRQFEAADSLIDQGQMTYYLSDWNEKKHLLNKHKSSQKDIIPEFQVDLPELSALTINKKVVVKENRQKAQIDRWDRKKGALSKMQYPLLQENLYDQEYQYLLPRQRIIRFKQQQKMKEKKEKDQSQKNIYKIIDTEFAKAKMSILRKKHSQYQQKIMTIALESLEKKPHSNLNIKIVKLLNPQKFDTRGFTQRHQSENPQKRKIKIGRQLSLPQIWKKA